MHNDTNDAPGRALRIGVLLDGVVVPSWVDVVLRQIAASDFLDLRLAVLNADQSAPRSLLRRLLQGRDKLLFRLYERIDAAVYAKPGDAFQPVRAPSLEGVPTIETHRLDDETLERIRAADLDVLLRFGFPVLRAEILE